MAVEDLRTRFPPVAVPVLSRRPCFGRDDGGAVMCNFCWCLRRRSRRAKQRLQLGHPKGFSLVWDRSWRFKCSNLANDRPQVVQTCGRGLSVLGGGIAGLGWLLSLVLFTLLLLLLFWVVVSWGSGFAAEKRKMDS